MVQPEVDARESGIAFRARLRAFEKRLQDDMRNIYCPTHLCIGQEAVPMALHENLRPEDWVFSTHRAHGHYLAKGGSEELLWDEIHGLETGMNRGFSGSQGFSDERVNFYCSAIVGGLVGTATGVAYALKMDRRPGIVVCCIGDAGTEQGVFWESLNWAALNKLPIAYICENNGKSVDSRIEERQARPVKPKVESFGIMAWTNVLGAIQAARIGIPSFCEVITKLECDHLNMATLLPELSGER